MGNIVQIVLLIGVILTFTGTMLTIYYTRKNLKTTKYIDIVTSERIKWLDIIRNEISDIVTDINFTIDTYRENNYSLETQNQLSEEDISIEERSERDVNMLNSSTSIAFETNFEKTSDRTLLKKICLFKLRVNPREDIETLMLLDYFIEFYTKKPYKSNKDIDEAEIKINQLLVSIQSMLKTEWEKVKRETSGNFSKKK